MKKRLGDVLMKSSQLPCQATSWYIKNAFTLSMTCKITDLPVETLLLLYSGLQAAMLTVNMTRKETDLRAETLLFRLGVDGEGLYSGLQAAVLLHGILVLFTGQRQVMFQLLQADLPPRQLQWAEVQTSHTTVSAPAGITGIQELTRSYPNTLRAL